MFRSWNSLNCILFVSRYGFSGWSLDVLMSIVSCFIDGMATNIDSLTLFWNSAMIMIDENNFWDISKGLKHPLIKNLHKDLTLPWLSSTKGLISIEARYLLKSIFLILHVIISSVINWFHVILRMKRFKQYE